MNPGAVLALIGDLYAQLAALREENEQLRKIISEPPAGEKPASA